ncbi:MAG: endonuclease [Candidatus Yanofskybacteria bacterium CG10_big_fil_rev_8_21_14_0_10_36_16]|uniref:Endonuclease n=1 Tax=Candidatus Yanofskybacteria bacterium CG10_big_fil_rev_8_21_14_0_10_36_16 TaxID=1975096 RepID=A0A2J0Q994_9BACT|nr:MAG: endonuclease [Candidatus Yanofskybacteria bacterium CG10_big_fil_rev_8_21_14_0_10_36_16]
MKYFTYVLKSCKNNHLYVGSTGDLIKRILFHNSGKAKSTKGYRPWKFIKSYQFNSRKEAVRYERFLKTGQQKEKLKEKYRDI